METVKITIEHVESGKQIIVTLIEDEVNDPGKTSINFDFGEGGINDHDGMPHAAIMNILAEGLGIVGKQS